MKRCVLLFYKFLFTVLTGLLSFLHVQAQHTLQLSVKNALDKSALPGATVFIISLSKTTVADSAGFATINNLASGNYSLTISHIGFQTKDTLVNISERITNIINIFL